MIFQSSGREEVPKGPLNSRNMFPLSHRFKKIETFSFVSWYDAYGRSATHHAWMYSALRHAIFILHFRSKAKRRAYISSLRLTVLSKLTRRCANIWVLWYRRKYMGWNTHILLGNLKLEAERKPEFFHIRNLDNLILKYNYVVLLLPDFTIFIY